jgi:hypothetical protein
MLKNKDGSVYRLAGPNPLMNEQEFWQDFIKHNFNWHSEVSENSVDNNLKDINQNEQEDESLEKALEIKEEKKVEINLDKKIEEKSIKKYNPVSCFCLPAKTVEKKDDLYDESYKKVEYLDKFITEIVVLEKEDFYIKIWCKQELTANSIIYPKNKDKRWWKIIEASNAPMGFYYIANPSDYTPSFE